MFEGEPLHWFVRDAGSSYAHHLDYERPRFDRALCGLTFRDIIEEAEDRPRRVCRQCQERMPAHAAKWWQAKAEAEARDHAETRRALTSARRKANRAAGHPGEPPRKTATKDRPATTQQHDDVASLQNELIQAKAQLGRDQSLIENYKRELKGLRKALQKARAAANAPATVQVPGGATTGGPRRARSAPLTGAKKRFYPVEGAPFPARQVPGGLPGLGKRR